MSENLGLYIHIPFCIKKCSYCDFLSHIPSTGEVETYINLLIDEISSLPRGGSELSSIFIGGGTPSICELGQISQIMKAITARFDLNQNAEVSIECNPGTVSQEKFDEYARCGINRISLGVQSLDERELKAIGRAHTPEDFFVALEAARKAGFSNINADIISGLPMQTRESILNTVDQICAHGLPHISLYSLILEEGTPLFESVQSGKEVLPDGDDAASWLDDAHDLLASRGCERYEISNWCKPGMQCRHNINYWNCGEYLAAGLGASSALFEGESLIRRANPSDMNEYASAIRDYSPAIIAEVVDIEGQMFETVMLGLRMTQGIKMSGFLAKFGRTPLQVYSKQIQKNIKNGLLEISGDYLRLTQQGMSLQNIVLLDFLQ